LASIAHLPGGRPDGLEAAALKAAAAQGVHAEALTPHQLAFWLTQEEIRFQQPRQDRQSDTEPCVWPAMRMAL